MSIGKRIVEGARLAQRNKTLAVDPRQLRLFDPAMIGRDLRNVEVLDVRNVHYRRQGKHG